MSDDQYKKPDETFQEYKKRVLDKLSPTICGAKFYDATLWLASGQTASCHHTPSSMSSPEEVKKNYKLLHNTKEKKKDRLLMQTGKRPKGCEYCWKIEDLKDDSLISDRVVKSNVSSKNDLINAKKLSYKKNFNPTTIEVSFDRTCQFACSYCSKNHSTTWVKDLKKNGPYLNLTTSGAGLYTLDHEWDYDSKETNPYVEAFFKWWKADLRKTVKVLRITGGEPFMSKNTWKFLDCLKENSCNFNIGINTNLGFDRDVIDKFLSYVDNESFIIYTSNEAYSRRAEYIRDGMDYFQWLDNVEYLLESKKLRLIQISSTINALCLDSLTRFLDDILQLKRTYGKNSIKISLNILRVPSFQSVDVLPEKLKKIYKTNLKKWRDSKVTDEWFDDVEIQHINRLINYLSNVNIPDRSDIFTWVRSHAEKDFKNFYQQYDKRRGKDFNKTFSNKLVEWYNSIEERK